MNIIEIVSLILFGFFTLYILLPWGIKIFLRKEILAIVKKSECVCLTFDDGPNPKSTPKILQLLNEKGVKATFFLVGEKVEKYPDLVKQIVDSGHEIGEHGYKHTHPWKCGPIRSLRDLIRGTQTIQKSIFPDKPVLFRPPYGKLNLISLIYVIFLQKQLVFWNIDPRDYEQKYAEMVFQYVKERIFPGAIVLLHDGRLNSSTDADVTVMALNLILQEATNRGLYLVTVSEALAKGFRKTNTI